MRVPEDVYALTRIDLGAVGTHGWQVRFQRRGRRYGKFFADRSWGGTAAAYRRARAWRDEQLARLAEAESNVRVCARSDRNSSGIVGVSRIRVTAASGSVYEFWQATWCPAPGRRRCVRFSIRRHGDRRAFRLAVEARQAGVSDPGQAGA
jgi:hypothetical protein